MLHEIYKVEKKNPLFICQIRYRIVKGLGGQSTGSAPMIEEG